MKRLNSKNLIALISAVGVTFAAMSFDLAAGKKRPKAYYFTALTAGHAKIQGEVNVGGSRWICIGNRCTTTKPGSTTSEGHCMTLAKKVGRIIYYGNQKKALSPEQLRNGPCGAPFR